MRHLQPRRRPAAFSRQARGKETAAVLPKPAGGKSSSNGSFWREQISSRVILTANFQSWSLASAACR